MFTKVVRSSGRRSSNMGLISFLTSPSESISFSVVSWMYFSCCCLCLFFYLLEKFLTSLNKDHWAYDNLDQIKGIYVIFVPFLPCLLWSLIMARIQGGKKKED